MEEGIGTIKDSIWSVFDSSFHHLKKNRVAIYGIGENTQVILEKATDYNIVGLFDGMKDSGCVYNRPILKVTDLTIRMVDIVIIVARSSNIGVILNRIARQCICEGIVVYDIKGKNLLANDDENKVEYDYVPDKDRIVTEIKNSQQISFDIFDTLIMRKVLFPADIFELMLVYDESLPKDFPKVREACERSFVSENKCATIHEIYKQIQIVYGWEDDRVSRVIDLEVDTDKSSIVLRKEMVDLYRYALKEGKEVYLISDMYYTNSMLESILKDLGIYGYKRLYVSCEYRTSKAEALFDIYMHDEKGESKLHIGDDESSDIIPAQARGINAVHIPNARWMMQNSRYSELGILASSRLEKIVVGTCLSRMFNSPFNYEHGQGVINNKVDYGYIYIGPLVLKICLWLIKELKNEGKKKILFAARDGYIIKQAFDYICQSTRELSLQSIYLYASRMAYVSMSLHNEEDIRFAYELAYDGNIEDMIRERFKLSEHEIKSYVDGDYESEWDYVIEHKDRILNKADGYRKCFYKYLDNYGISIDDGVAFFDFVSSGTCHMSFEKIIGRKLKGYYVSYIYSKYTDGILDVTELFNNKFGCLSEQFICNHYLFLENILTSYEPTLKEFNIEGQALFVNEERSEDMITEVKEIHQGIMEYIEDVVRLMNGNLNDGLDKNIVDKIFSYILKRYTKYNVDMKVNGTLVDSFCRRILNANDILGELKVEG